MIKILLNRLFLAVAVLAIAAGCSEEATPDAQADATSKTQVSVAADLPVGDGFDFYVLALSWSPAYCLAEGSNANQQQCAKGGDLGFVVHGLWPQFDRGYPEYCPTNQPDRVPSELGRKYLDIVPSMGLIGHQWRKHGSCSGLDQHDYFKVLRAAYDRINVPKAFAQQNLPLEIDALAAEDAFLDANPGMTNDGIAVGCQRGMLREIRICLTPALGLRDCKDVDRAGCKIANLDVPEPG